MSDLATKRDRKPWQTWLLDVSIQFMGAFLAVPAAWLAATAAGVISHPDHLTVDIRILEVVVTLAVAILGLAVLVIARRTKPADPLAALASQQYQRQIDEIRQRQELLLGLRDELNLRQEFLGRADGTSRGSA